MAELLSTLSIVSFAIAGVCFILSIFLWIFFRIPAVIGDLSGRTAKKSIAKMRIANEKSGVKSYKESRTNAERGKLTGTMKHSRDLGDSQNAENERPETGLLNENRANQHLADATEILDSDTTELLIEDEATAPLHDPKTESLKKRDGGIKLNMLDEVILVHSNEVIR